MSHPRFAAADIGNGKFPVAYGAGTLWFKSPDAEFSQPTVDAFKTAIATGYHHIDAAQMYLTEPELGVALQECGVPRSKIWLTTKTTDIDDVEAALETSLAKLQTGYVDMFLIHSPFVAKSPEHLQSAWRGMERCVQRGLAKNIGVSSFTVEHLKWILDVASVKPAINQIEMHPYMQQPELLAFMKSHDIALEGFASITPLTQVPNGPVGHTCKTLAAKYAVSQSAVLLRWVIDQGAIVITTSGKKERLESYLAEVNKFSLTPDEIQALSTAAGTTRFRGFFREEFEAYAAAQPSL